MVSNWKAGRNVLLADEMGLGKTAQIVATLSLLRSTQGLGGPFLVFAPLSTISHWAREVEAWSEMRCVVLHGTAADREVLTKHLWHAQAADPDEPNRKVAPSRKGGATAGYYFDVVVATYASRSRVSYDLGEVY